MLKGNPKNKFCADQPRKQSTTWDDPCNGKSPIVCTWLQITCSNWRGTLTALWSFQFVALAAAEGTWPSSRCTLVATAQSPPLGLLRVFRWLSTAFSRVLVLCSSNLASSIKFQETFMDFLLLLCKPQEQHSLEGFNPFMYPCWPIFSSQSENPYLSWSFGES